MRLRHLATRERPVPTGIRTGHGENSACGGGDSSLDFRPMSAPVLNVSAPRAARAHVPLHPPGLLEAPRQYGFLIAQFTRKEVLGRYRGSYLGLFWSFMNPLLLLCVYTVVFKYFFTMKATGRPVEGVADFALFLFSALLIFNLFAECLTRSPSLIVLNANYVTKVVFPLEILPVTVVLGALVHLFIGAIPLYLATFLTHHYHLHATSALWPLLLVPITLWAIAGAWLLAALGAFLRDLNEVMIALTQVLMYASAVFYPLSLVQKMPAAVQWIVKLNPLSYLCEQSRNLMVWGDPMDWTAYGWACLGGMAAAWVSYRIFMSFKPAFADVI